MIQDGRSAFKQQFPRFDPQADYYLTVSFSFNGKVVDVQGRNVLAAYASALVVPDYRLSQCLGFSANQMNEIADHFSELCGRLSEEMSSTDLSIKRAFLGVEENDLGIPPACGYYLGIILAQRLAEQYSLEELALGCRPCLPGNAEYLAAPAAMTNDAHRLGFFGSKFFFGACALPGGRLKNNYKLWVAL